jgi:hypothetical protein
MFLGDYMAHTNKKGFFMETLTIELLKLNNVPKKLILTRLDLRKPAIGYPEISEIYANKIDYFVNETKVWMFRIKKNFELIGQEINVEGYRFESKLAASRLAGAKSLVIMGASVFSEDVERIHRFEKDGQMNDAVILDAVLSEKADFALEFIQKKINSELMRLGQSLGNRFSCGYGDFELKHQRFFYDVLNFEKYGIKISGQYILDPEKTVTAIAPILEGNHA